VDAGADSIMEKYHQEGLEAGSTIRNKLGEAVKGAIKNLANGFINHPNNAALRAAVAAGNINTDEYYRHQLRIIYRLLFLFVIEERNLVYADSKTPETKRFNHIYFNYYSLLRLRKLAKKLPPPEANRHYDLWQSLVSTFSLFEKKEIGEKLGIMSLQGDLFGYHAISNNQYDLHQCYLSNAVLLNIIKSLSYFENDNGVLIAVNYGGLDVEEFGSVYEGLLELKLEFNKVEGSDNYSVNWQKQAGGREFQSHYTPEELVQPLIKHSLEYLIEERLASGKMASGEWSVVSGKYPAIASQLKNLIINLSLEYEKLSGLGSLEKGNGFSPADLPINQLLSQRGIVWNDFATPEVSKFYSGKHSRGLGSKHQQGIQSVPEHSQRQPEGNGNSPYTGSKSKSLQAGTNKSYTGTFNSIEQANAFLATFHLSQRQLSAIWHYLPLATRHSLYTTHHLLALKVCDVACGSGHILLSAARRIALAVARVLTDEEQPNPLSIRKAMKDVVRNCIYGVDKNPLAVELCKIALWLEAYNPGEPLNFLDHHIKCGDAIVGLAHRSELEKGIADEAFKTLAVDDKDIAKTWRDKNVKERKERIAKSLQLKAEFEKSTENSVQEAMAEYNTFNQLPETTPDEIERKAKAYKKFIDGKGFTFLKAMADTQVAQFFIPKIEANKDYLMTDADFRLILSGYKGWQDRKVAKATAVALEQRFFHWFIEFPEVFNEGGFDCVLGNPPYLGDKKQKKVFGDAFLEFVRSNYEVGINDLVVYFFLRIYGIISSDRYLSLITTSSISQGDMRTGALETIILNRGSINFAVKSIKWPGEAKLNVALVSIKKGKISKEQILLNGNPELYISSFLSSEQQQGNPFDLKQNEKKMFTGYYFLGDGFLLTNEDAEQLINNDPKYKDVIFPFINGDDLNEYPDQRNSRSIINFFEWPLNEEFDLQKEQPIGPPYASDYPECLKIVEALVKPDRQRWKLDDDGNEIVGEYALRKPLPERWWIFGESRPGMRKAISSLDHLFAVAQTTKHFNFVKKETSNAISQTAFVFATDKFSDFIIVQANYHYDWSVKYGSSKGDTFRYAPSKCFETYPFPQNLSPQQEHQLETIGEAYHEHRSQLMLGMQLGLTKTYNLFHSNAITAKAVNENDKQVAALHRHLLSTPNTITFNEAIQGILKLRELHVQMDEAVLDAYGWNDIALKHGFQDVDYLPENDRVRFTIHPDARKEVLKRLLELNHKIHEEEKADGLLDKKKTVSKKVNIVNEPQAGYGGNLFNQEN
jgi:hypothetical protein